MEDIEKNYRCLNPVVITVFNRPEKTKILIEALKPVEPQKIYVIADGPRENHPTDKSKVIEVREIIDKETTWNCEIFKIYAEKNMGGPERVPTGLDIVFEKEEKVIILGDDCIPVPQFFQFTDILLEKYKNDFRIGTICGFNLEFNFWGNPIDGKRDTSYFYSKIPASWGWATWKRVWLNFDRNMADFPKVLQNKQFNYISEINAVQRFFKNKYSLFYKGLKNNWDYRLTYSLFIQGQLSIIPNCTLVANIGADGSGIHYDKKDYVSLKKAADVAMPLIHPKIFQPDYQYDKRLMLHFFTSNKLYKAMRIFRNLLLRKKLQKN